MEKSKKKTWLLKQIIIYAILLVLICVLVVIDHSNRKTRDTTPPSISFSSDTIVYEPGNDLLELLKDVKATDEEDGDVTSSLRVRTVNISDDNTSAVVTYVAKDKANNIGLSKRIVKVKITETEAETDISPDTEETL